ncbi:MAG: hypothetical protein ABIJ81_01715 [Patescibacteria group bacterium]
MEFFFNLSELEGLGPLQQQWWLFLHGGWIVYLLIGLPMWYVERLRRKRVAYVNNAPYVLLAIDVPKETEQSPKAVESIFTAVAGSHSKPNKYQSYWKGEWQLPFSFEIVSLGGYIQFFIRVPEKNRDLIEAAIYAQYPDADIVESEDYIDRISDNFDTEEFDLWGTELILENKEVYPIRTYVDFEHQASEDFKDPMASLLELLSRIHSDEDVWIQLLVTPTDDKWKEGGLQEVKRLVEGKPPKKPGVFSGIGSGLIKTLRIMADSLVTYAEVEEVEKVREMPIPTVIKLTPGQRDIVEGIERKISKLGFYCKYRWLYWGRRQTFVKGRGVEGIMGAIKQYNTLNLNAFKPCKITMTKADYFLTKKRVTWRQRKLLRAYKLRSPFRGWGTGRILNIEELATIYHFPVMTVMAPLVKKTDMKKAEPPFALPVIQGGARRAKGFTASEATTTGAGTPSNLPFVD